jgi:hypothetical protein
MKSKKTLPYVALVIGGLVALTGIACIVMYVLEAVIARIGEADQSLLFWYLPILFIGLIGMFAGAGIGIWGAIRLKKLQQNDTTPDN